MTNDKQAKSQKPTYDSNPFTLSFNALGRLFETNTPWAVVIIALSFLGFIGQSANNFIDSSQSQPATVTTASAATNDATTVIALIIFIGVFVLIFAFAALVIGIFVQGALTHVALESEKGNRVSFSQALSAVSKRFWRLLGASLLAFIKIIGWTLLFIIPGIIAAYRYTLLGYVIMDESENEKGIKSSHDRTKKLVKGRLLEVFGVGTVATIIPVVGSLAGITGNAALYRQLQVYNDKNLEKPKKHWLNYLGFILLGIAILLMTLLIIVAIASSN